MESKGAATTKVFTYIIMNSMLRWVFHQSNEQQSFLNMLKQIQISFVTDRNLIVLFCSLVVVQLEPNHHQKH